MRERVYHLAIAALKRYGIELSWEKKEELLKMSYSEMIKELHRLINKTRNMKKIKEKENETQTS